MTSLSRQLQLASAPSLDNSQQLVPLETSQEHVVTASTELLGNTSVTKKVRIGAYKQKNAAVIQHHQDGQIHQQQMSQNQTMQVIHENHSDGTQFTEVQFSPTNMATMKTVGHKPPQVEQICDPLTEQQNAVVLIQQVNPSNSANTQALVPVGLEQHALEPASQNQRHPKKLVAEYKQEHVHIEQNIIAERLTKLSPRQSLQCLDSVPPVLSASPQQPGNALVPITGANTNLVVSQQPVPAITKIRQVKQGIGIQLESETLGKAGNDEYLISQIDGYREEQTMREITNVVSTADGDYEHVQYVVERRVFHEVMTQMYWEAKKEEYSPDNESDNDSNHESNSPTDDDPKVTPSSFEKCMDIICQSCTFNFRNPFSHQRYEKKIVAKNHLMTPVLRRGRAKGMTFLKRFTFPLVVRNKLKIAWVLIDLLFVLVNIAFSIALFVTGSREIFSIVHLVLGSVSTVLAVIDGFYTICRNTECKSYQVHQKDKQSQQTNFHYKACSFFENFSDFIRTILSEFILIPLLICDIFNFVITLPDLSPENPESIVGIVLFGLGLVGVLFYGYLTRLLILSNTVLFLRKEQRVDTKDADILATSKNSFIFSVFFVIHVSGQMIVQLLMLVTIGRNVFAENAHFYEPNLFNITGVVVSPGLWYLCAATAYLTVFGVFSFFVVANFWVQQYPISVCINLVKRLVLNQRTAVFDLQRKENDLNSNENDLFSNKKFNDLRMIEKFLQNNRKDIAKKIIRFIRFKKLKSQFDKLQNTPLRTKLAYPFRSPGMVIICSVYFAAHIAFVYYATVGENNGLSMGYSVSMDYLFGYLGWYLFYIIMTFLLNIYAFAIPIYWILVIIVFLIRLFLSSLVCQDESN